MSVCAHIQQDPPEETKHVWTMQGSNGRDWRMWCEWLKMSSTYRKGSLDMLIWRGILSMEWVLGKCLLSLRGAMKFSTTNVDLEAGAHI